MPMYSQTWEPKELTAGQLKMALSIRKRLAFKGRKAARIRVKPLETDLPADPQAAQTQPSQEPSDSQEDQHPS